MDELHAALSLLGVDAAVEELIETLNSMPSGVKLEEIYLSAYPEAATEGLQAISTGLSRFLDQYTRG